MFKQFSVGLSDCNHAFTAWLPENHEPMDSPELIDASISFLERGLPTKLHTSLSQKLEKYFGQERFQDALDNKDKFICSDDQDWSMTIKGSETSNPALEFWSNYLSKFDVAGVPLNAIFFPEIRFSQLVKNLSKHPISNAEQVDFYSPVLDAIIEIDGGQHSQAVQRSKDIERDKFSKTYSLKVLRLSTSDLRNQNQKFKEFERDLVDLIIDPEIRNKVATFKTHPSVIELVTVNRLQRVLLELTKLGVLPDDFMKWRLNITSDVPNIERLAEIAISDLTDILNVFAPIYGNQNYNIDDITKIFAADENALKINFYTSKVKDYSISNEDEVFVFNSPFLYEYHRDGEKFIWDNTANRLNFGRDTEQLKIEKPNLERLLNFAFDLPSFRKGQYRILSSALRKSAMLGLLPTGGGKSLTFQFPSIIQNGCSIVVCPISALVRDHVAELDQLGLGGKSEYINAQIVGAKRKYIHTKLKQGKLKFLFVSPEQFQSEQFREFVSQACQKEQITRFVIDEAHCLSEWGHEFRISYLSLSHTLRTLGIEVPIMCLTATASISVVRDISIEFAIEDEDIIYEMSQSRPELTFDVRKSSDKLNDLKSDLKLRTKQNRLNQKNAAIIFFSTVNGRNGAYPLLPTIRKEVAPLQVGLFTGSEPKEWDAELEESLYQEYSAVRNRSASVDDYETYKEFIQKKFKANEISLMVATKSFGMGVNKPNIRTAIHFGFASSIEALYQEAGRAGRDGEPATCISIVDLPEQLGETLRGNGSDVSELKKWQKDNQRKLGDLSTQLYLLLNKVQSIEEEALAIQELYDFLSTQKSPTSVGTYGTFGFRNKEKTQKTIYRLFQLGVIKDWTVEDHFKGFYKVWPKSMQTSHIESQLRLIVRKYEANESDYLQKMQQIDELYSKAHGQTHKVNACFIKLAIWNKLTFFNFRRQSLVNLYEAYRAFDPEDPEAFKATLDSYFKIDKKTKSLTDAVGLPIHEMISQIVEVFKGKNGSISKSRLIEIKGAIMRLSESYPENAALDLAFSISYFFDQKDGSDKEALVRLERFLTRFVKECPVDQRNEQLEPLYGLVSASGENELSQKILEVCDDFEFAVNIFDKFEHNAAFTYIISEMNAEMSEATWIN